MKLTFRNLDRDVERYLDKYGEHTTIGGHPAVSGYDKAHEYVFDAYLQAKAYDAVVDYLLTFNWEAGINDWLRKCTAALRSDGRLSNIKRLWRGVVAKQKLNFWQLHGVRQEAGISSKQLAEAKALALASMRTLRELVVELGDEPAALRLAEEIGLLEREEHAMLGPPTDTRGMDNEVFWDLIEAAARSSDSVAQQIDHLTSRLMKCKASDIRRFDKLLHEKMRRAYHWDLWALAYLAQNGCSDDAFEAFRAWLILQGPNCFQQVLENIKQVLKHVPPGQGTQAEGLLSAPAIAYEARAGKPCVPLKTVIREPQGEPWEESGLERRYPEVYRYYSRG